MAEQPTDSLAQSLDQPVRLSVFEGPLDLLLFLIRKNEIDIYDIPIEDVTRQYIEVLYSMEKMNLEIAGDFFVMASTLMYIKSRLLLPKDQQLLQEEEDDEGIDPRWELVEQLLEYKKFKDASYKLDELITKANEQLPRIYIKEKPDKAVRPLKPSDKLEIWNAFNRVLRRFAEKLQIGQIQDEAVSTAERMELVLKRLKIQKRFYFSDIFKDETKTTLNHLIATFLAILELTRLEKITAHQNAAFKDILIEAK